MRYQIAYTNSFQRDYQKMKRRGKDMNKLGAVITTLAEGVPLDKRYQEHALSGKYKGMRECHIESDWLLIWLIENDRLILTFTRTGTHSDLF